MTEERWLKVLEIIYQGLTLVTKGIKKIIDEVKAEKAQQSSTIS